MPRASVIGFSAVRGHDRAGAFLRGAYRRDRLPHALLFAGPDGVGKRSVALALAAWMLCERPADDACGTCVACSQLAAGSHPDAQVVTVAAGKKEIGIDRMRELKRFLQLRPVHGTTKIAVIDDAHLLTVAAQNALLKVLEEPPARSFLVLIAHSPDALLPTVRSRCQRVQFSPLPSDLVASILTATADVDAPTARALAALAEGSPGRAQALAQCVAGGTWKPGQELDGLRAARFAQLTETAAALNSPEGDAALKLEMLLSRCRDDAVRAVGAAHLALPASTGPAADVPPPLRTVLRNADAVDAACNLIRRGNANRQLLLEALLLRLAGV